MKNRHSMYRPRAGRRNFSPQQVHFDVVLKERLLPKGDITAWWIKRWKTKDVKSQTAEQSHSEVHQSSWALQSCLVTPALTEKWYMHTSARSTSGQTSAEKNFWEDGSVARERRTAGEKEQCAKGRALPAASGGEQETSAPRWWVCAAAASPGGMELWWWGAAWADRTPGCTLTAGNHPDNCSRNRNTAGWGFAIQKSGASKTGSCFFLLLFLSNKIPSCLAWETCNIAIPKAIKKSHKPDLLQHPPQWSYLKAVS